MIVGSSVSLRALNVQDSTQILEWVNNPELKRMIGTVFPISDFEHISWFEKKISSSSEKMFGIQFESEKKLVGIVGLKNIDYINSNAELYIYIGDDNYMGKGLGKDTLITILKFAFEELNLHRIYLEVFAYNNKAKMLYEKVGFEVEGVLRDSLYKNGKYHNKYVMGIIKNRNLGEV